VQGLNEHVLERYGGIYENDLPGFPRDGYSDAQIVASKRAAAGALALAALPDFGPTAVFFDVEGDPVSFDGKALRWVGGKADPISERSAARGIHITKERFRAVVNEASTSC